MTSLCSGAASAGQRCVRDCLVRRFSLLLVLLIHLWTFYILQPPCVNCSQPLFKLINLGLEEITGCTSVTTDTIYILRVKKYLV